MRCEPPLAQRVYGATAPPIRIHKRIRKRILQSIAFAPDVYFSDTQSRLGNARPLLRAGLAPLFLSFPLPTSPSPTPHLPLPPPLLPSSPAPSHGCRNAGGLQAGGGGGGGEEVSFFLLLLLLLLLCPTQCVWGYSICCVSCRN